MGKSFDVTSLLNFQKMTESSNTLKLKVKYLVKKDVHISQCNQVLNYVAMRLSFVIRLSSYSVDNSSPLTCLTHDEHE